MVPRQTSVANGVVELLADDVGERLAPQDLFSKLHARADL